MNTGDAAEELLKACERGDTASVRAALDHGADPNTSDVLSGYTPLHLAASRGYVEIARILVDRGADADNRDNNVHVSPLAIAVISGQSGAVEYLLSLGCDPGEKLYADDQPLVEEASEAGFSDIAAMLRASLEKKDRLS